MTQRMPTSPSRRFLDALYGDAPRGALVEVRYRWGVGMRRMFVAAAWPDTVATMIATWSAQTDVYVGVICRRQRGGGRGDLVAGASVVWVDCDTVDSVARARAFSPAPSMVVRSGSGDNIHAYWLLVNDAEITSIEYANRRLAHALGADMACTDGARIMRAVPSLNWKHDPPVAVELESCDPGARYALDTVVGTLPDAPDRARDRAVAVERTAPTDDPLLAIDPVTYVERLAGVRVPRSGKIRCPFHDNDDTPSLHVYAEPDRGWYCYGCLIGGDVYDFAAWRWGLTTRGGDFVELRRRLTEMFAGDG